MIDVSIVIPTLDDAATLGTTLERLNPVVATIRVPTEVVVVDAGSTDSTLDVSAECADKMPLLHLRTLVQDRAHPGFGSLVRLGLAYARGRSCLLVSADARDPLDLIPEMVRKLQGGAHLVLCSRYDESKQAEVSIPRRFRVYQGVYRRSIRMLLGPDLPDSTYGFRAFNRTFVLALGLSSNRLAVCPEITFKVLLAGGKIEWVSGVPAGPMIEEHSKFKLRRELLGYAAILARAAAFRRGMQWF